MNLLLVKEKKHREILPLQDPIDINLFSIFIANVGNRVVR